MPDASPADGHPGKYLSTLHTSECHHGVHIAAPTLTQACNISELPRQLETEAQSWRSSRIINGAACPKSDRAAVDRRLSDRRDVDQPAAPDRAKQIGRDGCADGVEPRGEWARELAAERCALIDVERSGWKSGNRLGPA